MRHHISTLLLLVALAVMTSCVPEEKSGGKENSPLTEAERADCVAKGGEPQWFGLTASEGCVMPPEDLGKSCNAATDCSVQCLAATRTCGPLNSGEYNILDEEGRVVSVVVE